MTQTYYFNINTKEKYYCKLCGEKFRLKATLMYHKPNCPDRIGRKKLARQ